MEAPSKTDLFSVEHEFIDTKPKVSIIFLIIFLLSYEVYIFLFCIYFIVFMKIRGAKLCSFKVEMVGF